MISVTEQNYYTVEVIDDLHCLTVDSIYIPQIIFPEDQELDDFFCSGSGVLISPEIYPNFDVSWSTGSTQEYLAVYNAGPYAMTLSNLNCHKEFPFYISEEVNPVLELSKEGIFCEEDSYMIDGYPVYASSNAPIVWENSYVVDSVLLVYEAGTYVAVAENEMGCTNRKVIEVPSLCEPHIFIPSAFTPNDDGINDVWKIALSGDYSSFEARIYDRWGAVIYESTNPDDIWNGAVNESEFYAQNGVYHFDVIVRYSAIDGSISAENLNGIVTVIR